MSPAPDRHQRFTRPARALGAAGLAGALSLAGLACTSTASTKGAKSANTNVAPGQTTVAKAKSTIDFRSLDAGGPLTIGALKSGTIDIAELFTFTPQIAQNGWVTLTDDKHLQAADNFVALIRTDKNTDAVGKVIDAVDAKLTHDNIMDMVKQVSVNGKNPKDVADGFLAENDLPGSLKATGSLTVGSANFTESEVVGRVYAEALTRAGVDVDFKDAVGARQVTMPMMEKGDIDLMPEFTYSLLAYLDSKAKPSNDLDQVTSELTKALPKGLSIRKPTDVSDVNAFVVTKATAQKYHLSTISDLAQVPDTLTLGGPPECPKNAACIPGLEKVYGLRFNIK